MSYLCRIRFDFGGRTIYQYYVVNEYELAKLKKLDYEFEAGCCGQSRCFVCTVEGCSASYHDHIVLDSAQIEFFNVSGAMKLSTLLDAVESSDEEDEEEDEENENEDSSTSS